MTGLVVRSAGLVAVDVLLTLAALPFLAAASYVTVLALRSRRRPAADSASATAPRSRFAVVVPAHNEEVGIARTVQSLLGVDYPAGQFQVIVVADNCTDATAQQAEAAGATVLVRDEPDRRGKGYALTHAFDEVLSAAKSDAVVVVDADTSVSPNLLRAFDARLRAGAEAMQAHYGVRDSDQSWRTRLVQLGLTLFHGVRSSAREALGVSCGLRGNGMCFDVALLRRVPHAAYSIVEDLEYGITLGLAGVRVHYVEDAKVSGDMPTSSQASRSQRARWEGGRREVTRRYAWTLVSAAFSRRDRMLLDLALDLLVPPLSTLVAAAVLGVLLSIALAVVTGQFAVALVPWVATALGTALYILRGCFMTGNVVRALGDLAWAPAFMAWKLTVRTARAGREGEWVRTSRTSLGKGDT